MKWSPTLIIADIDVSSIIQKKFHHIKIIFNACLNKENKQIIKFDTNSPIK